MSVRFSKTLAPPRTSTTYSVAVIGTDVKWHYTIVPYGTIREGLGAAGVKGEAPRLAAQRSGRAVVEVTDLVERATGIEPV